MDRRRFIELSAGISVAALAPASAWSAPQHVVVVGGGILGASIAYHLARRGARVTLCEKAHPAAGATGKSFAWINATFSKQPRHYHDLNVLGMEGWRQLEGEFSGDLQIQWGGCVEWYPPGRKAGQLREEVARLREWGYVAHTVDLVEFRQLLPFILPGPFAAASYSEREGTLDPVRTTQTILAKAKQLGAQVLYPCEAGKLMLTGGRVEALETTHGMMKLDALVLASGVDTPRLAAMAGVKVPLKESPGVLAHTKPLAPLVDRVALGPEAHLKQNPDGRVVTGSDFGGSPVTDTSRKFGEKLVERAARYLPELARLDLDEVTLGWRVMPLDEYPILGFANACPNLYIAATHSGVTLAPAVGQFAAAEILEGARVEMLAPYRPSRFAS